MEIPFCTHSQFSLYHGMRIFRSPGPDDCTSIRTFPSCKRCGIHFYLHPAFSDFCICCRGDKLININSFFICRIYVLSKGSKCPSHVWRTTGNSKTIFALSVSHAPYKCALCRIPAPPQEDLHKNTGLLQY